MNPYQPKYQKKLLISPKSGSYDLSFRGKSQGQIAVKPQTTRKAETIIVPTMYNNAEGNLEKQGQSNSAYQNQFLGQQGGKPSQQKQVQLQQQQQQNLAIMIQMQQMQIQQQGAHQSQQSQPQQKSQQPKQSQMLDLLLSQPKHKKSDSLQLEQSQLQQQNINVNVQFIQAGSIVQNIQPLTNRSLGNANHLYNQFAAPQSTKATTSANKHQKNSSFTNGVYSAKNSNAPQSLLQDLLSKMKTETSDKSAHTVNCAPATYVPPNPELIDIYNPTSHNLGNTSKTLTFSQHVSSTKSSRIHSNYFPAPQKKKDTRNPSLDKLNDSSFIRLKSVQSPKQVTLNVLSNKILTYLLGFFLKAVKKTTQGSNKDGPERRENALEFNTQLNRSEQRHPSNIRDSKERITAIDNPFFIPSNVQNHTIDTKRSGNSISRGNGLTPSHNNSFVKMQPQQLQSTTNRGNGTPLNKKDLTIRTRNSIEGLKDILKPMAGSGNKTANTTKASQSKGSRQQLEINSLQAQSSTTTNQQLQARRALQKIEDQINNRQASESYERNNGNNSKIIFSKINTTVDGSGVKTTKNKPTMNSTAEKNYNLKNISITQPVVELSRQTKENTVFQTTNMKLEKTIAQQGQISRNIDEIQKANSQSTASQTPFCNGGSTNDKRIFDDSHTRNTDKKEKIVEALDWSAVKIPITPIEALAKYQKYLTPQEKNEILEYKRIYFLGHNADKSSQQPADSPDDFYANMLDHIGYRYEIQGILGKGSFGQVLKVFDHKRKEFAALKVIGNKKKFHEQALIELNILHYIKERSDQNQNGIVKICDFVVFRCHVCLVFELLSINLYDVLRNNHFQSLPLQLIRKFAIQLLNGISFLRENRIIHCDLKPENILLKHPNTSGIKIADFGSSCFDDQVMYTYIQSRYYRSPEVIFGIPYGVEIDIWSFGCIIAELFIGYPIFPGEDENEQILYIMELIGVPSSSLLKRCSRKKYFFDENDQPLKIPNSRGKIRVPNSKTWKSVLGCNDENFIDFLKCCLTWEPSERMIPMDGLLHPWILEGLTDDIRTEYISTLQEKAMKAATMKEYNKQSSIEAQCNADAQSAAMAQAVLKIYQNKNKRNRDKKLIIQDNAAQQEDANARQE